MPEPLVEKDSMMHKKEIEWRIAQVKHNIAEFKQKAVDLYEYPDSVFVYEQLAKAANASLVNLELQLSNLVNLERILA